MDIIKGSGVPTNSRICDIMDRTTSPIVNPFCTYLKRINRAKVTCFKTPLSKAKPQYIKENHRYLCFYIKTHQGLEDVEKRVDQICLVRTFDKSYRADIYFLCYMNHTLQNIYINRVGRPHLPLKSMKHRISYLYTGLEFYLCKPRVFIYIPSF